MIGESVLHFRILEEVGRGGMGVVYRAQDTKLDRIVALKFLPQHLDASDEEKARFIQEAKAASALNHPNVCTIYDIKEFEGKTFIVMEFIEGRTLREAKKDLTVAQALNVAIQVAEGLGAAHEKGIVHRDIKADNIMIRADGRAQIMDFGLAKLPGVSFLTKAGSTIGTTAYMSPEQAQGGQTDQRTDIFSFGVLLYELLAHQLPFRGAHEAAVIYELINVDPSLPSAVNPEVRPALDRIVMKCLEKDQRRRYQSVRDLVADLRSPGGDFPPAQSRQTADTPRRLTRGSISITRAAYAGVAVLVTAAFAFLLFGESGEALDSLAVLPFENGGNDESMEYLSDGITESLIHSLSQLPQLKVMSRSSVFRFKGNMPDPQLVGKDLGVRAVLTGRILQRGDALLISAELTDVADNSNLWGEQYNRKAADILAVQEEIAREITQNLRLRLADKDAQRLAMRPTVSTEAFQLYLKGRYHWNKRSVDGIRRSIEYFRRAVDEDPNFALAYSGMADAYGVSGWFEYGVVSPLETYPKALEAARRALEIDPERGESHASLAFAKLVYTFDRTSVDEGFRRSIALNPSYATAHQWYAEYITSEGDVDRGVEVMKHALTLDPLSLIITRDVGWMLYFARRYDEANEYFLRALELDPHFMRAHLILGQSYLQQGLFEKAEREFETAELSSQGSVGTIMLGYCHARAGNVRRGRRILDSLLTLSSTTYVPPGGIAFLYDALGNRDKAFEWLHKAADEHSGIFMFMKVDPLFDGLRNDPRYADLLRRVGLSGDRPAR
jgi:serine/threonine protein kinase/tetratricopeptide (TPR) repeat protein